MIPHCYAEYTGFITQGETEARQSSDSESTAPLSLPICTVTLRSKVRKAAALGCPCLARPGILWREGGNSWRDPGRKPCLLEGAGGLVLDNKGHCLHALSPSLPCERQPLRLGWRPDSLGQEPGQLLPSHLPGQFWGGAGTKHGGLRCEGTPAALTPPASCDLGIQRRVWQGPMVTWLHAVPVPAEGQAYL